MPYITRMQSPKYHQITFFDAIDNRQDAGGIISMNSTNTHTEWRDTVPWKDAKEYDVHKLGRWLGAFTERYKELYEVPRQSLYDRFYIPKKTGGLREINAPHEELQTALGELKRFFEKDLGILYHTNAFAYVKDRCTKDLVQRHQMNESKWFLHTDYTNFFGSTTPEFVHSQLRMIFPFSFLYECGYGRVLEKALDLAFLNGGLPMGTVISPMLTNVVMIPIDHRVTQLLRKFKPEGSKYEEHFVYTRYADDMTISCRYKFDYQKVIDAINKVCEEFNAPYKIKEEKTHFGSSAGSNWILGMLLNKDNNITVGNRNKKRYRAIVSNFLLDVKNGKRWELHDLQVTLGLWNYYHMIEPEYFNKVEEYNRNKYGENFIRLLKKEIGKYGVTAVFENPVIVNADGCDDGEIPW